MAGRRGDSAAAPLLENKAAPASASEAEAGGGYHHHNNNYYYYVDGCPGCAVDRRKAASPGIPYANFIYVWIVTLCTALPISSLFPFLYFMIRDLNVAERTEDIGFYAGFVGASFMFGRCLTSTAWGIAADRIGRKPVVVFGISSVSGERFMCPRVVFNTLFGLSVNYWMAIATRFLLGALNGLLGPIKVSTAWGIGLIIGPALGGYLALETLHRHKVHESTSQDVEKVQESGIRKKKSLFRNWPLMSSIIVYCIFSFHDMAYTEVFSLWAESDKKYGGLSLSSEDVGQVLAVTGASLLVYQLFLYPRINKVLGPIKSSRIAAILCIPILFAYPYMTYISEPGLSIILNIASAIKNNLAVTIITGTFILQNNAVPQDQRGAANGLSMTGMSFFKALAPAGAGIVFSWAQKRQHAFFFPGDQMVFFLLNVVELVGLILTFKPFLAVPERCDSR
ncbi:putative peptide/nitrate transporter [Zea mays]|uniref:Putative peptide/nitrate transporter n=1 Tax=Zea mays TaxID=4577 RepID=A0A1D6EIL1_MAIZE|nr:putative peptide/nitrate transporter [Zea mays]